jgi:hypothetical protein
LDKQHRYAISACVKRCGSEEEANYRSAITVKRRRQSAEVNLKGTKLARIPGESRFGVFVDGFIRMARGFDVLEDTQ